MTDNEISKFLKIADSEIFPDWKRTLERLSQQADECNKKLCTIAFVNHHRSIEAQERKRTIPFKTLLSNCEKFFDKGRAECKRDTFYCPDEIFINGEVMRFNNDTAYSYLKAMLDNNFTPQRDLPYLRCCSLAIKKGFSLLSKEMHPSIKVLLRLWDVFTEVYIDTCEQWEKLLKQERNREINRKNSSTSRILKPDVYKKHDLYPQLDQMIKSFSDTPNEIRKLNEIIGEMLGAKNSKTIRRYRHLFFGDIKS